MAAALVLFAFMHAPRGLRAQQVAPHDSVSIHFVDTDLRLVLQTLAPMMDRPMVVGPTVTGRVSIEAPVPVPRSEVPKLVRSIVESQGFELVTDSLTSTYQVRPKPTTPPIVVQSRPRGADGAPELFVIRLSHARAEDVASTVNALYGRASAIGEGQAAAGAGPTTFGPVTPPSAPNGRAATLTGETLAIIPDAASNSLLIRATPHDYDLIAEAVRVLDVRPLQVLIEVMIAEVRSDSRFALGISSTMSPTSVGKNVTVNGVTENGAAPDSSLGEFVLHVMKGGGGLNFRASIEAAQSRGEARILSRPVVLAANGEPAEILVGSQRPFVAIQRTLPTESASRDQVVQYRNVGTRLLVKPTISPDGYVALAVTQEVNQATSEVQFDAPVISTRTVQTSLVVRDSQTVILGGLSDRQQDAGRSGVPILSRIPGLGALFGSTSHSNAETEFFLFITPHIIRSDEDAAGAAAPYRKKADAIDH